MKTEREVRAYRDDLRTIIKTAQACGCLACVLTLQSYQSAVLLLDWTLGEAMQYDNVVEQVAAAARR